MTGAVARLERTIEQLTYEIDRLTNEREFLELQLDTAYSDHEESEATK